MSSNSRCTLHPLQALAHHPQDTFFTLQDGLESFRCLIDHAGDEVVVVSGDGRIVFANQAVERNWGYSTRVLLSKSVTDLTQHKITLARWKKEYWMPLKKAGHPISYTIERAGKGGKAHRLEVTAVYMHDKLQEYVLSVAREITNQVALQQELKESQIMKALQNFIAGTMREIQHPLKGVLGHAQALVEKYRDRPFEYIGYKEFKDVMRTLTAMRDQVKCCFETTNQLLDINRRKVHLKGASCDVREAIWASVKGLQHSLEAVDVHVRLRLAANLPAVAIGALELNQVLTNILVNAMEATPRAGEVEVRAYYQKKSRKVLIRCLDEGAGIAQEDLPRIFEPFFTTKNRGSGKSPGLGLTIAYAIIKSFQGEIIVKSKLREGALVEITLPACPS